MWLPTYIHTSVIVFVCILSSGLIQSLYWVSVGERGCLVGFLWVVSVGMDTSIITTFICVVHIL